MITLAFTRPERRLEESIAQAKDMGFRVLAAPSLDVIPGEIEDFEKIADRLFRKSIDICIFSSVTAVEECVKVWRTETGEILSTAEVIPIGPSTAEALIRNGIKVGSTPDIYSSQGLVDHLASQSYGKKVLIIHSDKGSDILKKGLRSNGAKVTELVAYRLKKAKLTSASKMIISEALKGKVDVFAFTSPLSAVAFFDAVVDRGHEILKIVEGANIAAIGEPTAVALRSLGLNVDIMPENSTFRSLLESIKKFKEKEV